MENDQSALFRKLAIENSHAFAKLEEKTQILITKKNRTDIFRTRQTHSYEVATISTIIATNIGYKNINSLVNVCLCHDLGLPAFGHSSARYLDAFFKGKGLAEGFCDNASTFEVLNNNSITLSNYEIASLIKYPTKLYPNNSDYLNNLLNIEIKKESHNWGRKLNRTVACEVMDLADRISYATSDLVDAFTTGYTRDILSDKLIQISSSVAINREYVEILTEASNAASLKNKKLLRKCMIELKFAIVNDFYWNYNESRLDHKNKETMRLIDELVEFNHLSFISNEEVVIEMKESIECLEKYVNFFYENPDKMVSSFYRNKYIKSLTKEDKLRALRDMIGDTSDQYLIKWFNAIN